MKCALEYCLSDYQLAKEFCAAARHPAWVGWMHDHGYFDSFFVDSASQPRVTLSHNMLAHWVCSDVRHRYPDLLLGLFRTHQQRLSREFSRTLAHALWVEHRKKPDAQFATWLAVLLRQGKDAVDESIWSYLLQECRIPDHTAAALGLFDLLSTPELDIERDLLASYTESTDASKRRTRARLDYSIQWPQESRRTLREAWEKVFEPHISEVAEPLAQIVVRAHFIRPEEIH